MWRHIFPQIFTPFNHVVRLFAVFWQIFFCHRRQRWIQILINHVINLFVFYFIVYFLLINKTITNKTQLLELLVRTAWADHPSLSIICVAQSQPRRVFCHAPFHVDLHFRHIFNPCGSRTPVCVQLEGNTHFT